MDKEAKTMVSRPLSRKDLEAVQNLERAAAEAEKNRALSAVSRTLQRYLNYNVPTEGGQWFDWKNSAAVPVGSITTIFSYTTPPGLTGILKRYGVGYMAGSAQSPVWNFDIWVNGMRYPISENQTLFSIPSPTPIDRDLLENYVLLRPGTLVQIIVNNPAAGAAMNLWTRIIGFYAEVYPI